MIHKEGWSHDQSPQKAHIKATRNFAEFIGSSPYTATAEDLRAYPYREGQDRQGSEGDVIILPIEAFMRKLVRGAHEELALSREVWDQSAVAGPTAFRRRGRQELGQDKTAEQHAAQLAP